MDKVLDFFKNDRFAASNEIFLMEAKPGYAKSSMKVLEKHLNGVNTVQGGAIFTLADLTFAAAVNAHGNVAVALNVNISFLKAAFVGDTLIAEAKENSLSPKIGSYAVEVKNSKGDLIALFQGTAYRKKEALPF